jgi:hypothetical protein
LVGVFDQVFTYASMGCGLSASGAMACEAGLAALPGNYRQAAAGNQHVCGLLADGSIECENSSLRLSTIPGRYSQVAAGDMASCAVRTDGSTACWNGKTPSLSYPVPAGW